MENIIYNRKVLARHIKAEDLEGPFMFFTENSDHLQISRWNHPRGRVCPAHKHNTILRTIDKVHEVIHIISGRLRVTVYNENDIPVKEIILKPGDTLYSLDCGHKYEVLEDNTRVIEVKNGPFMGDENYDKERTLISEPMYEFPPYEQTR